MNSEEGEVTKENPEVAYVLVRDDRKENKQRLIRVAPTSLFARIDLFTIL